MNHLPYLGLSVNGESPRGYLLRTAFYNGYTTIGQLAARLGADINPAYSSTLLGKSDLVEKLIEVHAHHAENIKNTFYKQTKGIAKTTDIIINKGKVPFKLLRSNGHHLCWQCLNESNHISLNCDISIIDVCIKHETYLQHSCATCNKPFNWRNTTHKACDCPIIEHEEPAVINCAGAKRVALAISKSEYQFLVKLLTLLRALRQHKSVNKAERNNTLNLAIRMLDGSSDVFADYLRQEQNKYPGLPLRVLISPLLALGYEDINKKISDCLIQFSEDYPLECNNCECASNYLTVTETTTCLEITNGTLNKLCQNQLINSEAPLNSRTRVFPYKNMCHFFRQLIPAPAIAEVTDNLQPISYTAPGNSLIEKLKSVVSGEISTVKVNQSKGLSGVLLVEVPSIINIKKEMLDLLTTSQVAAYLNVYPDAIRSISKTQLLPPSLMVATQPFFHIRDIELFDKKYVFAANLARKYHIDPRLVVNRLHQKNIQEVSGPKIDGTLTPLYYRDEVENLDLFRIEYCDYEERYSHNTKYNRSDIPKHLTAKGIAKLLGIAVAKIIKLENYGLLEQVPVNDINDKRRIYSQQSYDKTVEWFNKARRLDDFADELQIKKWYLTRIFITSKYVTPLTLSNDHQLLSPDDQQKIKDHLAIFCTCSEADKYHCAPDKYFHNLVKTNRFPVVSKDNYLCNTEIILLYWSDVKSYRY